MQSIYLRSLQAKDFETGVGCGEECDGCSHGTPWYHLGPFNFCKISCANQRHSKIDLGVASRTVQLLIILSRQGLMPEVARMIAQIFYTFNKRRVPSYQCNVCHKEAEPHAQFVNFFVFCGTPCRRRFIKSIQQSCDKFETKDFFERTYSFGAIW